MTRTPSATPNSTPPKNYSIIYIMIKVYTTPTCIYCHALMDWLEQQGIEYEEHSADELPNITAVPVTIIGDQTIVGFDRPAIKKALKNV